MAHTWHGVTLKGSLLWPLDNAGATSQKYKVEGGQLHADKPVGGLCFGYSTVFVSKMLKGNLKPKDAKPEEGAAGPLQAKVEMVQQHPEDENDMPVKVWDDAVRKVITGAGYKVEGATKRVTHPNASTTAGEGWWVVDIGVHWVALGSAAAAAPFFYMEPNIGLLEYKTVADRQADIKAVHDFYKKNLKWKVTNRYNMYHLKQD